MTDSFIRTFAKTVSWRVTGSLSTFLIAYILLGNIVVSSVLALVQLIINTILYFIHERIWNKTNWEKK